jgi:plasmid stabilization system protein ParE
MNTRVTLNDSWGPGAAHSLKTPVGQQPEFTLHARHLRGLDGAPQLAHFTIDLPSGYLADGWQGVNFIPLGSREVAGIRGLPPWSPSRKAQYRRAIEAVAESLADPRTKRLEAVVPYLGKGGQVGYNKVRLFYLSNAARGKERDLVVVKIATHVGIKGEVQARQEGNGYGPPH